MTSTTTPPTTPHPAGIQDAARHLAEARTDAAVAMLERIVADFPAYVTAHVLLAKAYDASGRTRDALEAWHRAYFLMPTSPLIVRERTRLLRSVPAAAAAERPASETAWAEKLYEPEPTEPEPFEPAAEAVDEAVDLDDEHEHGEDLDEVDDLDTLIQQLENAPRIRPDAAFRDDAAEDEEEDEGEVVSETLARIYEAQRQYDAAARAYEQLADQRPDRAAELRSKAAELRGLAGESDAQA